MVWFVYFVSILFFVLRVYGLISVMLRFIVCRIVWSCCKKMGWVVWVFKLLMCMGVRGGFRVINLFLLIYIGIVCVCWKCVVVVVVKIVYVKKISVCECCEFLFGVGYLVVWFSCRWVVWLRLVVIFFCLVVFFVISWFMVRGLCFLVIRLIIFIKLFNFFESKVM